LLIGGCDRILQAWQEASTELSTDWFKSIMASTPPPCSGRYEVQGYQPPFETLPAEADYVAAQEKAQAQGGAKGPQS
jgi:hypothetical protein